MNIWEIFDTNIQLTWQQSERSELALLNYDNKPYMLQIYRTQFNQITELIGKNTAEVSFFRYDLNDQQSFSTTYDVPSPTMLYGVISNALTDKFAEYDAFYFSAEKSHSKNIDEYEAKVSIYQYAARRVLKRYGAKEYQNINNRGTEFIISKITINNSEYKNPVNEYINNVDWGSVPRIASAKYLKENPDFLTKY